MKKLFLILKATVASREADKRKSTREDEEDEKKAESKKKY